MANITIRKAIATAQRMFSMCGYDLDSDMGKKADKLSDLAHAALEQHMRDVMLDPQLSVYAKMQYGERVMNRAIIVPAVLLA